VIEYRDAAKITDLTKSRGELDVSSAGGRITGYAELFITGVMWTTRLCGRTEASPTGSRPAYLPIIVAVREMQLDGRRPSEALQKRK
jgi:hypothetical protein